MPGGASSRLAVCQAGFAELWRAAGWAVFARMFLNRPGRGRGAQPPATAWPFATMVRMIARTWGVSDEVACHRSTLR
jgi:hypothetical protein